MVYVPHTEEEYQRLVAVLDVLIDEVGEGGDAPSCLIDGSRWGAD
jgi:hypothetical protein